MALRLAFWEVTTVCWTLELALTMTILLTWTTRTMMRHYTRLLPSSEALGLDEKDDCSGRWKDFVSGSVSYGRWKDFASGSVSYCERADHQLQ